MFSDLKELDLHAHLGELALYIIYKFINKECEQNLKKLKVKYNVYRD